VPTSCLQKTFVVMDKDELRERLKAAVAQVGWLAAVCSVGGRHFECREMGCWGWEASWLGLMSWLVRGHDMPCRRLHAKVCCMGCPWWASMGSGVLECAPGCHSRPCA